MSGDVSKTTVSAHRDMGPGFTHTERNCRCGGGWADPATIYLEPGPGDPETGRAWCEADVWSDTIDYQGERPTRYVRADLMETRRQP